MINPITVAGKVSKEAFVSADGSALVFGVKAGQNKKKYACKIVSSAFVNASWEYLMCMILRDADIIIHGANDESKEFILVDYVEVEGEKCCFKF